MYVCRREGGATRYSGRPTRTPGSAARQSLQHPGCTSEGPGASGDSGDRRIKRERERGEREGKKEKHARQRVGETETEIETETEGDIDKHRDIQ